MRPIRLTFAGLRSYRAQAVIDFTGLDLFAIVGDTGAGKSTIIEALSLALYSAKTWKGGASKADMIADGERTMGIELVFSADGHRWTVTRSWKRSGPGVNKLERSDGAEKVDGSTAVTERITELLGLNHSQFTQAVVMPQGRFDELLRATASERNKLLASILGLDDVRRTGTEAARLRDEWQPQVDAASARRSILAHDPVAGLDAAQRSEADARDRLAALTDAVGAIGGAEQQVAVLASSMERLERSVAAVPAVVGDPISTLEAARDAGERLTEQRRALRGEEAELDKAIGLLDDAEVRSRAGFDSRDAAIVARSTLRSAAGSLRSELEVLADATSALARLDAEPPVVAPDPRLERSVARATDGVDAATDEHRRAVGARDSAGVVVEKLLDACARLEFTESTRVETIAQVAVAEGIERERGGMADVVAVELARVRNELDDAIAADAAATAAAGCAPGDDCPVCMRELPASFVAPSASDLETARRLVDAAATSDAAARSELAAAARDVAHARRQAEEAAVAVTEATGSVAAAEQLVVAGGALVDADHVDAALAPLQAIVDRSHTTLAEATAAAEEANRSLADERSRIDAEVARHGAARAAAHEAVVGAERRVAAQQTVVTDLPPAWLPPSPVTPDGLESGAGTIDAMLGELDVLARDRAAAEARRATVIRTIEQIDRDAEDEVTRPADSAAARINAHLGRIRDVVGALRAGTELVELVDRADLSTPAAPDDLPTTVRAADLPAVIAAARDASSGARSVLTLAVEVGALLEDRHRSQAATVAGALASVGCATTDELHGAAGAARVEASAATAAVDAAQVAVAAAASLDRFLAVARPFVANLSVLVVALRDQHFVGHLVKAREAELIAEANRRLQAITRGRFGFVADFGVVNVASGEIRSPDTLSGGERFQAALALALSLVEIASRGHGRLDAVFVDEGFGSLDSSALDSALDTLGTVAGGGKMVGLISHLKPVAEYVETVMLVKKSDVLGSTISLLDADERDRMLADDIRSGLTGS